MKDIYFESQEEEDEKIKHFIDVGDSSSILNIASNYFVGLKVKQNYKKAFAYYLDATKFDNAIACSNLGYCYFYGLGTKIDYEMAFKYYSKAVELNDILSFYLLGDMFYNGFGCQQDKIKAVSLYQKAYDEITKYGNDDFEDEIRFYPEICLRLGKEYLTGEIYKKDLSMANKFLLEAKKYFEIRVEQGYDNFSQNLLNETNSLIAKCK
jgi:TPR repeat protein